MKDSKQLAEFERDKRLFELPKDIVDTLCDNLSIKDQFRFARVCKSTHSSVYKRANPIAVKDTPWLFGLIDNSSSSLFETTYKGRITCYKIGTRPFKYSEPNILGYSKGWFYVHYAHNDFIQLVNLFIDVQIDLPPLSNMVIPKIKCRFLYAQAFALSLCKSMRPLMIAIVDQYGELALCKTRRGSTWKAHEHHRRDEGYYVSVTFYHEKLYALRKMEFHTVDIFKVGDDDLRLFPVGVIEYKNVVNNLLLLNSILRQAHLVEDSEGDNMFIVMQYQRMDSVLFVFEVFKVVNDGDEFMRMGDLGDHIILLDDWCSEMIDVKDYCPSVIFKGNQICFKSIFQHHGEIPKLLTPSTSPYCCRIQLRDFDSHQPHHFATIPIVPPNTETSPPSVAAIFDLSKLQMENLKATKNPSMKISIYKSRQTPSCSFDTDKLLGKIYLPLDLNMAESRAFHAEPDPRFVFRSAALSVSNPRESEAAVFTCKFSFRDRSVSSRSSMSEQSNSKRWLPSLASQKDHSAERKGWSITVHDLSGSPVAAASMITPFVPSPGSHLVSRSNPGAWLILRSGGNGTWKPWGRLEAGTWILDRGTTSSSASANSSFVNRIQGLLNRDWRVTIIHVYREVNKCADFLATYALNLVEGIHFLQEPPETMIDLLQADNAGEGSARMCPIIPD
ncbi:hypothetical protein K1719_036857 [Acacia pycnantha]|nr:hypothetical protein K1719_036857 [Acacia pycnantha]